LIHVEAPGISAALDILLKITLTNPAIIKMGKKMTKELCQETT